MPTEKPPIWESDAKKAEEMAYEDEAKRNDIKRAENMAYAEDKDRSTIIDLEKKQDDSTENIEKLKSKVNNLKEKGEKYQTDIIKKEQSATKAGEKAGKEYDKNKAAEGIAYEDKTKRNNVKRAESMAYTKEALKKTLPEKNSLSDMEKQLLEAASNKVGEKAGKKHDIENMAYEDEAKRNNVKKAESIAYTEEAFRKTLPAKDWTPEQNKDLKDIAEKVGEEYDTERRQSLQGIDDRFLPQYREMALHDMEESFAEKILKTDSADQMAEIANSIIATQESVDKDKKYLKKMSPLEWINYKANKIKNERKAHFSQEHGIPKNVLENAYQENLNRATEALNNNNTQILHLEGAIKKEVAFNKRDFTAVSENVLRLKGLETKGIELEKDVEEAKKVKEIVTGIETGEKEEDKFSEKESALKVGNKNKIASTKETETKIGNNGSTERKSGKASKRELPNWLKILFEAVGGLFFIGWAALFSSLEKQVGKSKKGK